MISKTKNNLLKNLPRWVILVIDLNIVAFTYIISNFIINNFTNNFNLVNVYLKLPIVVTVYAILYLLFGTYKGVIRQTGLKDAQNVFIANILSFFVLLTFSVFIRNTMDLTDETVHFYRFSYSILFIHSFVATVAMVFARISYKSTYAYYLGNNKRGKKVIIYGAGDSGAITLNALAADQKSDAQVLCFIDDDPKKSGKKINRLMVHHSSILTDEFIQNNQVDEVIISIQNISKSQLLKISEKLTEYPIKVKITPAINDWINGNYSTRQIKHLKIEDLLGRDSIELNNPIVENELENKTILISGAAGSIGSEIARQVARKNFKKLILLDIAESALYDVEQSMVSNKKNDIEYIIGNVRDLDRMKNIFELHKPDYIYHAAAYKHVPLMEKYPYEAVNTNVRGTKIMADLSHEYNVEKFVMVSTDKAVNPTNVMGATKRCAEIYVSCLNALSNTNFIVTRFGNVLGSNGSVIPLFKRQLEQGGPLTVTHPEITRYFMTIPEACQLVLEAGTMGKGGEIFVFDMGESMKIIDLAKRMIRLSGYKYPQEIDIKVIGLRPGEKIFEELLASDENTTKTHHEKIMIAKVNYSKCENTFENISTLCYFAKETEYNRDNIELVRKIKQIVPEFKSQNSTFEILDQQA
ncbi:polysaccharide biosynthesis protein [Faecalibacter bovis]|uniref:Polysaccharide biosynthesis protein n=1 Tax=Faecalibacter bovis TaxID=2898187 RepID=A0ABX7XG30_9FLAO|nr:nucleoside-diphosphate sugar epimerase/dehydratase [Faecalibacter bovis]MBS7332594.1 polysaccharide biosynthesis protein [Weeksellaceae bacterium]QTV06782.1 polysaccharide biosynthesis protein [Faecalibacter bovis]